jgi:acyl-CoA oxidase
MATAPTAAAIRRVLDDRWPDVRDEVRAALGGPRLQPPSRPIDDEAYRAWVRDRLDDLARVAGPWIGLPKEHGGRMDPGGGVTAFATLAYGDLSLVVKAGVQWGLTSGAIYQLGTPEQHDRWLPALATGRLLGCFAMTETGHGSDVQSIRTTARFDPDHDAFVLTTPDAAARKDYIGNAARDGHVAVVFAQLETPSGAHGVHALVVRIRDDTGRPAPGVTIGDCGSKGGLNGVDNGRLSFDDVMVPRGDLLGRFGTVDADGTYRSPIQSATRRFFTMLGTLVEGRIGVAGAAIGATERALAIAIRYAEARRQFHHPDRGEEIRLLDYPRHQRRLLPPLATTCALHLAQAAVVSRFHDLALADDPDDPDRRRLENLAAGMKVRATRHATDTIQACREACGGAGYLAENRLTELRADTDVFTTFEGDNTVLLQLVAKGLLTRYGEAYDDLDALGTIRFVAEQVVDTMIERIAARPVVQSLVDAVRSREGEESDLRDRGAQLELFEFREEHVLASLARRIREGAQEADEFAVFTGVQDHVAAAARAHVDRLVLELATEVVDRCDDPDVAALLGDVLDLYALTTVEAERAWFQEHGRLSAERSKAVRAAVDDLCARLRPQARLLVDAFGIPEPLVDVPMLTGSAAGAA